MRKVSLTTGSYTKITWYIIVSDQKGKVGFSILPRQEVRRPLARLPRTSRLKCLLTSRLFTLFFWADTDYFYIVVIIIIFLRSYMTIISGQWLKMKSYLLRWNWLSFLSGLSQVVSLFGLRLLIFQASWSSLLARSRFFKEALDWPPARILTSTFGM